MTHFGWLALCPVKFNVSEYGAEIVDLEASPSWLNWWLWVNTATCQLVIGILLLFNPRGDYGFPISYKVEEQPK